MRCSRIHRSSKASHEVRVDAYGGKTWFRIETEATAEADVMRHKVAKYFCQEKDRATRSKIRRRACVRHERQLLEMVSEDAVIWDRVFAVRPSQEPSAYTPKATPAL